MNRIFVNILIDSGEQVKWTSDSLFLIIAIVWFWL